MRFSGFDDEWKTVKLNKVGDIVTGATPPTKNKSNFTNSGYLWVTPGDIDSKKFVSKTERNLSEEGLKNGRKLEPYSILVTCIGATIGKICMINKVGSCNQQLNAIYPNDNFYPEFIYYNIQKTAKNLILLAGNTATPILNKKSFGNLSYNFPSFDEQKKIALFIDKIDQKIELLEQKHQKYQDFKKYLMQQIFAQKLRFNFSDEWKIVKLESLIKKGKAGGTPSSTNSDYYNGDIPFLSIRDMTEQGKYILKTEKTITEEGLNNSSAWIIPKNSLLYSIYASIGLVAINRSDISTSQAIYGIILKEGVSLEYMYYYLTYFKKNIHKYIETGTQGNLNAKLLKSFEILLPSLEEQEMIVNVLSIVDEKIENSKKEIEKINEFKKGLLQQMFIYFYIYSKILKYHNLI